VKPRVKQIHFVGIGGVGMSGLAEVLVRSGYRVSGSDLQDGAAVGRLRDLGAEISIGHGEPNVGSADVVVYSSAISALNPELRRAEELRIPVIGRAEMLGELMRMKYGVAVSGAHGKTTTTSLIGDVLEAGDLDPTTVVGGRVHRFGTNSRLGSGDILVAEADESDGSFLSLIPTVVVVTNIDREHLDHYGTFEALKTAFRDFANRVPFWGAAVVCLDDPHIQALLPEITRRTLTYGVSAQAEISATSIEPRGLDMHFTARSAGRELGPVRIGMPGRHNVQNALAAIAVGLEFDVPFGQIAEALGESQGVGRRFDRLGEREGVLVIDDYAHHPTEIRATLEAARAALDRRLVVVFQPHRYTRTRDLLDELAHCFHDADHVIVTEVYAAGEEKIPGAEGAVLARAIADRGHRAVEFVADRSQLLSRVRDIARVGDAVLFMGAGDIGRSAQELATGGRVG